MAIRHLACCAPTYRDDNEIPSLRRKHPPRIDFLRVNPAGYYLNRMLAPGTPAVNAAATWAAPRAGRRLMIGDGVHCETRCGEPTVAGKRCIVIFHGNSTHAAETLDSYACLRAFGDLLAVNAPGYGATPPARHHRQLEWQMAVNVQAVSAHVADAYAPQDVLWLGFSLGSAQAAMGFQGMPGSHLLLDAPFTSVRDLVDLRIAPVLRMQRGRWLAGVLTGAGMLGLPKDWRVPGSPYATDGLDTEAKLRRCRETHHIAGSRVGIISAEHDEVMSPEFPARLWRAYHGALAPMDADRMHCLRGVGHCGSLSDNPADVHWAYHQHMRAAKVAVAKLFNG